MDQAVTLPACLGGDPFESLEGYCISRGVRFSVLTNFLILLKSGFFYIIPIPSQFSNR